MSTFVQNPTHYSADCLIDNGFCTVNLENFLFLDDGKESAAIDQLEKKCGKVVLIPDVLNGENAFLYHTGCERMSDVVSQIFHDSLHSKSSVARLDLEMTIGEIYRQSVAMPYSDCKQKIKSFSF